MLDYLKGILARADVVNEEIVIDHNGMGFRLTAARSLIDILPEPGEEVTVFTELIANERDFRLFGFASEAERQFFRLICDKVRNVGPTTAIRILSGGPVERLRDAVLNDDYGIFSAIKGIGKKSSERIVRELKEYVTDLPVDSSDPADRVPSSQRLDAIKTLVTLGLSESAAIDRVGRVMQLADGEMDVENIIKQALSLK